MVDWKIVAQNLCDIANKNAVELNDGQKASLLAIAQRLPRNGVIIADEVGMGKTRIATTVTKAVIKAGGRVAILVPPGLGSQWGDELRKSKVEGAPEILRSLGAYLNAWAGGENEHKPWANHPALIISHAFCNWQVKSNTRDSSRWSLLPQTMALMQARLRASGRLPRGAGNRQRNYEQKVVAAAKWITDYASTGILESLAGQEGFNQWGNDSPFFKPANYRKTGGDTKFREALERVVGLGLGEFDLVVIDEAHKSRGAESNLERLLMHVISVNGGSKRLAMTATPIELDVSQWQQILGRIGVTDDRSNAAISDYADAVERVQRLPNDEQARDGFYKAAQYFQTALGQYLLRRDKREVQSVKDFSNRSGNAHNDYRSLSDIAIKTEELSPAWKQTVCAAEALSFVARGVDDQTPKRLRLTLGNGHGISALMDEPLRDDKEDPNDHDTQADAAEIRKLDKKVQRIEWWKRLISRAFQGGQEPQAGEATLYEHPAILAAVEAIETVCRQGEKVLVFGRFTRPMKTLVHLLNAREMLRCLYGKEPRPWPQEVLRKDKNVDEEAAALVALQQLKVNDCLQQVKDKLSEQYKKLEGDRKGFRESLLENIGQGLEESKGKERIKALLKSFSDQAHKHVGDDKGNTQLVLVAHAVHAAMAHDELKNSSSVAQAFESMIDAASDKDETDLDGDGESEKADDLWSALIERLSEAYGRTEGGFARLMNGNTKPPTRRLLQLAFNREHSHPKVLVAQSVVGREGLNLHEACRTVILLHAEWNPGIVEQQIGRVDRINSLWEKKLDAAIKSGTAADEMPRIEVRPVIFQGTYDEHNWKVLMQRWDDLRAQLHGVVITPSAAGKLHAELVKSINDCAPNFSPTKSNQAAQLAMEANTPPSIGQFEVDR